MKNNALFSIVFVLVSVILYAVFIQPWYVSANEKRAHLDQLHGVLRQVTELQVLHDELSDERNNFGGDAVELLEKVIPPHTPENVLLLHLTLDRLMRESGLAADTAYTIGEGTRGTGAIVAIPVSFSFSSVDYHVLRRFMNLLRDWMRGARVVTAQIGSPESSPEGGAGSNFVSASIATEVLFLDMSTTPPPSDDPTLIDEDL